MRGTKNGDSFLSLSLGQLYSVLTENFTVRSPEPYVPNQWDLRDRHLLLCTGRYNRPVQSFILKTYRRALRDKAVLGYESHYTILGNDIFWPHPLRNQQHRGVVVTKMEGKGAEADGDKGHDDLGGHLYDESSDIFTYALAEIIGTYGTSFMLVENNTLTATQKNGEVDIRLKF